MSSIKRVKSVYVTRACVERDIVECVYGYDSRCRLRTTKQHVVEKIVKSYCGDKEPYFECDDDDDDDDTNEKLCVFDCAIRDYVPDSLRITALDVNRITSLFINCLSRVTTTTPTTTIIDLADQKRFYNRLGIAVTKLGLYDATPFSVFYAVHMRHMIVFSDKCIDMLSRDEQIIDSIDDNNRLFDCIESICYDNNSTIIDCDDFRKAIAIYGVTTLFS